VNNSTSRPLAASPTPWPKDSFRALPTVLLFLFVVAPVVVFGVWQGIIASSVHLDPNALANPTVILESIGLTVAAEGVLVAVLLICLPRVSRLSLRELGYRLPAGRDFLIAAGGAIAMAIVADGGSAVIQSALHVKHDQTSVAMVRAVHDPALLAAFAIFACVVAPFMEETIFRVFLFNAVRRYVGFFVGALVSGVCFGLAHGDLVAAIPLMCAGFVLAAVYNTTRNAFASMLTHGLFNTLTFVAIIFFPQLSQ
jgi:membrane protease YdiL (CAAX protease family)